MQSYTRIYAVGNKKWNNWIVIKCGYLIPGVIKIWICGFSGFAGDSSFHDTI